MIAANHAINGLAAIRCLLRVALYREVLHKTRSVTYLAPTSRMFVRRSDVVCNHKATAG